MPKIPQRDETVQPRSVPGVRDIGLADPTGGLRIVAGVAAQATQDVKRSMEQAQREAELTQKNSVNNGLDEVINDLTSGPRGYQQANATEVTDPKFKEKYLEWFDVDSRMLMDNIPLDKRDQYAETVRAYRNSLDRGLDGRYIEENQKALKASTETRLMHLGTTGSSVVGTPIGDGWTVDKAVGAFETVLGLREKAMREGSQGQEFVEGFSLDGVILDDRNKAIKAAIISAVGDGNPEVAKALLAKYEKEMGDYAKYKGGTLREFVETGDLDQRIGTMTSDLVEEVRSRFTDNGKISPEGYAFAREYYLDLHKTDPEAANRVEANAERFMKAMDENYDRAQAYAISRKIKEIEAAGGVYVEAPGDLAKYGAPGVRAFRKVGQDAQQETDHGLWAEWAEIEDEAERHSEVWFDNNKGRMSEGDKKSHRRQMDAVNGRDPEKQGDAMTILQATSLAGNIARATPAVNESWFNKKTGSVKNSEKFHLFENEFRIRIAEHDGPITTTVVNEIATRMLAKYSYQVTQEGRHFGSNTYDVTAEEVDNRDLKLLDVYGDWARENGFPTGTSEELTKVEALKKSIKSGFRAAYGASMTDEQIDRSFVSLLRGSIDEQQMNAIVLARMSEPDLPTFGDKANVPFPFRQRAVAILSKTGAEWTEGMIEKLWSDHLNNVKGTEGYGAIKGDPARVLDFAIMNSATGMSLTEFLTSPE